MLVDDASRWRGYNNWVCQWTLIASDSGLLRWTPCMSRKIASGVYFIRVWDKIR